MNRYEKNYKRIDKLTGGIEAFMAGKGYLKLKAGGFMDLVIERIGTDEISLAHYYEQNGDLVADPEMTVRVRPQHGVAEALTFSMPAAGFYQEIYFKKGEKTYVCLTARREQNAFLDTWLMNLKHQGFYA
ncbi:MAG: hypothetical protein AB7D37_10985 [Desulfovibrio sp.]